MKTILHWALGGLLALGACTQTPEAPLSPTHLGITTHTLQNITGKAQLEGRALVYQVIQKETAGPYHVSVDFDGLSLESTLDYGSLDMTLDGHGAVLSNEQKYALLRLSEEIYTYLDSQSGAVSLAEASLVRLLGYWSQAPTNYQYGQRTISSGLADRGNAQLRNEGITCIRKGTNVTAEYDDSRGSHRELVQVGSKARSGYGCMGRCGADCGRWWIPSSWTKDCMDHDQCSNVNFSSGGSSDANCGDEFDQAADDWAFGVWRGCSG